MDYSLIETDQKQPTNSKEISNELNISICVINKCRFIVMTFKANVCTMPKFLFRGQLDAYSFVAVYWCGKKPLKCV